MPTGRKKLSMDEFITSYQISLNQYNFAVPNFGQGFNLAPGISWARPLKANIVFGAGISYQYRGPFEPFAGMSGKYDPGDEILLTGGLDFRLTETSTFSTDMIWNSYGADRLNGELN